uniref:Uncharacterized protein n=1 Tax=Cannabis sativa TaxID=3483 RepID=A0A803R645_CANSA
MSWVTLFTWKKIYFGKDFWKSSQDLLNYVPISLKFLLRKSPYHCNNVDGKKIPYLFMGNYLYML